MNSKPLRVSPDPIFRGFIATIRTLRNDIIMYQIERSEQDIKKGSVRECRAFLKELYSDERNRR